MVYAGIDIGGTTVKWCLMDASGAILHDGALPTLVGDPEALAAAIAEAVQAPGVAVCAAGVSCAGRVNLHTDTVIASNLRWRNVPFRPILEKHMGCPVVIDNDVAGALMGEWAAGACQGQQHVVYITLGTGVGGAFLIDGKPFRGYNNTGGEIGHIVTHADGLPCPCGGRGCFEQYGSATALSRMAGGLDNHEVFRLAAEGDETMARILDDYVHELVIGLANLIAIFRPQMLVLGGGLSQAGEALRSRVEVQLRDRCPCMPGQELPQIVLAKLGNKAGMIGGGMLAMKTVTV